MTDIKLLPPAGWHTEGHLTDKSATTYSPAVRDRWLAKGWPVWPLYTADQVRANVLHHTAPLRYALENAARDIKTLREVRDSHAALAQQPAACPKCDGTGEADSGGIHPWGAPATIPCDCQQPAPDGGFTAADMMDARQEGRKEAQQPAAEYQRVQPCGCVLCICEDEKQCHGCGAKHCGNRTDHPAYVTQQPAAVDEKYAELIYAVANKYPGESRHETALRYIRQAESADHGDAQAATQPGEE